MHQMKISEAKNGKVRYTESKVASGESRVKTDAGKARLQRNEPDYMEYLSEKDRRRWNRLSDSKKERILNKARNNAAVREQAQLDVRQGNNEKRKSGSRINASTETKANNSGPSNMAAGSGRSSTADSRAGRQNSGQYEGRPETGSIRQEENVVSVSENRSSGVRSSYSGSRVNSSSSSTGGFVGLAVSAAKKTASRVSKSLKNKSEKISGGEDINAEAAVKATDEVKKVMNPIKKTVGALFALLAVIIGPTSMAMILACLTGDFSIIPTTTAEYGNQNIGVYGLSVGGTHDAPVNLAGNDSFSTELKEILLMTDIKRRMKIE